MPFPCAFCCYCQATTRQLKNTFTEQIQCRARLKMYGSGASQMLQLGSGGLWRRRHDYLSSSVEMSTRVSTTNGFV